MIDPRNITKYDCSDDELEEQIIFWILVAGKTAKTTADRMLPLQVYMRSFIYACCPMTDVGKVESLSFFSLIQLFDDSGGDLAIALKKCGFGQFNQKARYLTALVESGVDLRTADTTILERVPGIGPKTSRCFIMHTRQDARHAGLDTHILKWLDKQGVPNVPKSTPSGKTYARLEKEFLGFADRMGRTPADLDLEIWKESAR